MDSYFSDKYRLSAKRTEMDEEEEEEDWPTELYTQDIPAIFATFSVDKLSVKYSGRRLHGDAFGIFQSNIPAPTECLAYYFEIYVKNAGVQGDMSIGFSREYVKTRDVLRIKSCHYHGNSGVIFSRIGETCNYVTINPTYTTDDTVGLGINYVSQEFFFTKNGAVLRTIPKDFTGPLYPTVVLQSKDAEVTVNFGPDFIFDFKGYEASVRNKQKMEIEKITISPSISHGLVRTYLLHYGYEETLKAFDLATESAVPPVDMAQVGGFDDQGISYALLDRKNLRELIMKGEIDAAIARLQNSYPQLVQDDTSEVCFLLRCQKFTELIRSGETAEAVLYGRAESANFIGLPVFRDMLADYSVIIAYERPEESDKAYLLGEAQKEVVADAVNAAILSTNPNNSQLLSPLERLIRQLTVCSLEMRDLNKYQGEAFSIRRFLDNKM